MKSISKYRKLRYKSLLLSLGALVLGIAMQSCMDDDFPDNTIVEEGRDTKISLQVKIPEMTVETRSDMASGTDSELKSLWVGIFSASSGECKYAGYHNPSSGIHTNEGGFYELKDIDTKSGMSYIVAVGNPVDNYGYDSDGNRKDLGEMLPQSTEKAVSLNFTWDKYNKLSASQLSPGKIDTPVGNLVMSGVYTENRNGSNHGASTWEEANFEKIPIPVAQPGTTVEMSGAIHLRRLISQVKFNIKASNSPTYKNGIKVLDVTPQSYKVYNVPVVSSLHEQKTSGSRTNAGDFVKIPGVVYGDGALSLKANYPSSALYSGKQYIKQETNNQGEQVHTFDFWALENKRMAVTDIPSTPEGYYMREKERKIDTGLKDDKDKDVVSNTGIYTALCGESGEVTMNNCATYVEIRCRLEYTQEGLNDLNKTEGNDTPETTIERRTAEAVYVVHLGGIGNKWNDFCHRRNHKYTYNITVVDLDKIVVEAESDDEITPGAEGVVTDVTNPPFELDAHYGVFNIRLTELERTGSLDPAIAYKDGRFPFRVEVYDGNENRIIIDQFNYESIPEYYWDWVEFRPAESADKLAPYKPYKREDGGDGNTFRLNDIANVKDFKPSPSEYYTVYINEYTYETELDEGANNWVDYVNKPNRICWLQTQNALSNDQESIHIVSKYCFSQQSIQSFYDMPGDRSENLDAIGMERTNEIWGLDLRWDNVLMDWSGQYTQMTMNNGRHNTVLYRDRSVGSRDWTRYVDQTKLQVINNINTSTYQEGRILGLKRGPYYVPAAVMRSHNGRDDQKFNINTVNYVTIMNACMNRNRDNNGNGQLDLEEIRWYVPASSEIVDLVLGRRSLDVALMDYDANPDLNTPTSPKDPPHHVNTRFHYATSNNRKLWSEEGVTVTSVHETSNWDMPPWDVRCVRALGTNLATDNLNDLSPAFTVDNKDNPRRIYPTYYEGKNKRGFTSSVLPPHQETSDFNRICETGFEFTPQLFGTLNYREGSQWENLGPFEYHYELDKVASRNTHDTWINQGNALCQEYGRSVNQTGWRLPNIMEAALIKLALNNAQKFDRNLGRYWGNPPYMAYNFISATYREYGVNKGEETNKHLTGFYLGVVYDGEDRNQAGNDIGRVQCLTQFNNYTNPPGPYYYVRCVRDIR